MLTVLEKFLRGFYSIKHRIAGWRKSSPCTKYMLFTEVWIQVFTDTTRYLGLWFPLNILCINQWYVLCYCYICRCSLLLWFISFLFFLSFHSCAGRVQMFFSCNLSTHPSLFYSNLSFNCWKRNSTVESHSLVRLVSKIYFSLIFRQFWLRHCKTRHFTK